MNINPASKYFCIILFSINFLLISCKDAPTIPGSQDYSNYFPGNPGTSYKYSVTQIDSTGNETNGIRFVSYDRDTLLNLQSPISFIVQRDSITAGNENTVSYSFFRRTGSGVFYYVDTSRVYDIIPDTLREFVSLAQETRLLLFPVKNSFWFVYRVTVDFQGVSFTPIDLTGTYIQTENITVHLISGDLSIEAEKIKYDLKVIEDISLPPKNFSAFGWFSDGIGLVKLEGDGLILNALLSGEINFDDSSSTFSQELIDYNIE